MTVISIDNPLTLEEKVIEMLKTIFDPEIPVNIYDLGLIYEIKVDEEKASVHIQMTLTSPMCPVAQTFPQTVQDEILKATGVSSVSVELVWDPPWTKDRLSESTQLQLNLL